MKRSNEKVKGGGLYGYKIIKSTGIEILTIYFKMAHF